MHSIQQAVEGEVAEVNKDIPAVLDSIFLDHPEGEEARLFLENFRLMSHQIDDIIDLKIQEPEAIIRPYYDFLLLLSCPFYQRHSNTLLTVFNTIMNTWLDSVKMENSAELWQREQADTLRTVGLEMTLTIVQILAGYDKRREISLPVREFVYKRHHDEFGNPH